MKTTESPEYVYSTLGVMKSFEGSVREAREKEPRRSEEPDSDARSCDIKRSHAPPKFRTVGTSTFKRDEESIPRRSWQRRMIKC